MSILDRKGKVLTTTDYCETPPTSDDETEEVHEIQKHEKEEGGPSTNELVLGEFTEDEVAYCALDKLNKSDKDYTHIKHKFVNEEQYEFFCQLPGGTEVKERIVNELMT